ncbi:MAG: NAD(P)H-hydrate dehydratase [Beijerinckiaceae bacterium]
MADYPNELLTCAVMAEADRLTIAGGIPGIDLMERAGAAVADAARQLLTARNGRRAVILCGPGNNGGDGFVAARYLRDMGFDAACGLLGDIRKLTGDAAQAAAAWKGKSGSAALADLDSADLVVDALFGAGLARDIDGRTRAIVERVNTWRATTGRPILAVDVPSGIDGDTGAVRGVAIAADVTVTFFRLKPGHLLMPGREHCGETNCADIGIKPDVLQTIGAKDGINAPALWRKVLPVPQTQGHKYSRGHALVVSGPANRTGAARLAARGALRAGAGLVTIAAQGDAIAANAAHLTAIMLAPFVGHAGLEELLNDARFNIVALGPGLGVGGETRALVQAVLEHANAPAAVLDADALTSFAGDLACLAGHVRAAERPVVLTPHEGEFARLFPELEGARIVRARAAAQVSGAILCLKGPDTIVAAPDGRTAIAAGAPPWLATAGSGDVLAGAITGLIAQRMPAFEACAAAVWMHARAAAVFGPGLIAEDIPEALPAVWRELLL